MLGVSEDELSPPPIASAAGAREVLRVWTAPGEPHQMALSTTWNDPGAWGLLLVDAARHAARAYAAEGMSEAQALDRILQLFRAEIESPTDSPTNVS